MYISLPSFKYMYTVCVYAYGHMTIYPVHNGNLAIHVQLLPVERPSFSEVNARLAITLEDLDERSGHGSVERVDSIEPQPSYRLSYHEFNRSRSKSLSPIPTDLTNSRQTTV